MQGLAQLIASEPVFREPNAKAIALQAVALWRRIDTILSPVLGRRGVAALFQRSLRMMSGQYPEFATLDSQQFPATEFASLEPVLKEFGGARASAAHTSLIQTFHGLLVDLIGASLVEQLLASDPEYAKLLGGKGDA